MSNLSIVSSSGLVCLVGGAPIATSAIAAVLPLVKTFVGVDGGADHLRAAGVVPQAVIGDLDSLTVAAREAFAGQLYQVDEQETTDFEKALLRVEAPCILGLGLTGGRMDHSLSVLNVMARYAARAIVLANADDVCFVARQGRTTFGLPAQTRISLMPLYHAQVSLSGVVWPFDDRRMQPTGFTSPSNAALGGPVICDVAGPVLVTLPRAHLTTALQAAVRAE